MDSLEKTFLAPLGKEYCAFFYYFMLASLFILVATAGLAIYAVIQGKTNVFAAVLALVGPFLVYFNNRLLYSICVK